MEASWGIARRCLTMYAMHLVERIDGIVLFLVSDDNRFSLTSSDLSPGVCDGASHELAPCVGRDSLLVDDAHLLGAGGTSDVPVVRALACCVATHPGPVRGVHVTRGSFYAHEYALWCLVPVSQTSSTSGG